MKFCVNNKNIFVEAICSPTICSNLTNQNQNFASQQYGHLKNLHLADKSRDGCKLLKF